MAVTPDPDAPFASGNGGQVFVPITNKDVWLKLNDLETKVDALSIKIYASWVGAGGVIAFVIAVGGISVG